MRFALIGYTQKDMLNPAFMGINASDTFLLDLQFYISNQMTEDNGYLNVLYVIQSNGRKEADYEKSPLSKIVPTPFCIETTEGYDIELELDKQAPIPRYFMKTSNFDLLDERQEIRPFRIAGEMVAKVVGEQPSFAATLKQNVMMGFNQYEITGVWTKENLISTVRKFLERGAEVTIKENLIASDEDWVEDLKAYCYSFFAEGTLVID